MTIKLTHADAVQKCVLMKGELAVFDTEEKRRNGEALVLGRRESVYVGAKWKDENMIAWSNGVNFTADCSGLCRQNEEEEATSLPSEDGNQECVALFSNPEHPTVFQWVAVSCSTKLYSLCQRPAQIPSTTSSPTEPPTTPLPFVCPHGHNWKFHEGSGYCFWETTYETDRLNWYQAREFCQSYGGDLASYESVAQEDFALGGAKGHYRGLWLGLRRDENDVLGWSDGSALRYRNWNIGEPNFRSRTRFCVKHGALSGSWELDYCGVKRWFVCKARRVQVQKIPDRSVTKKVKCNITDVSVFSTQWYLHGDYCYMTHEDDKYTWDTANTFCKDNGGHLASIHSFNETDFMLFITSSSPSSDFWIGLSSKGIDSPLEWSDGTPVDFENELTNTSFIHSCVSFKKTDGAWAMENCNRLLAVMCKRSVHSKTEFPTSSPAPKLPGNCPTGWYPYGNKCYIVTRSARSSASSWNAAVQECEAMQATLVSVHSQSEQDFLTDLVCEHKQKTWIGLKALERGTLFQWRDQSRIDYTNWDASQPQYPKPENDWMSISEKQDMCVTMSYEPDSIGKWSLNHCEGLYSYICEKPKDSSILEPSMKPFTCPNITGWLKLDSTCYGLFETPDEEANWLNAQSICRQYGANLVSFKNVGASNFLKRRFTRKNTYYWTAVREKRFSANFGSLFLHGDKFELVTGHPILYTNWMSGQPLRASYAMDNCVASNSKSLWMVKSCQEKHSFVCEWISDEIQNKKVSNTSNQCPYGSEWIDLGGPVCYFVDSALMTSNNAMFSCFLKGGNLASFHSEEEILLLIRHLKLWNDHKSFEFNIGLGKRDDGSFAWLDHTPLDFTYWDEEGIHNDEYCVKMKLSNGKWRTQPCYLGTRKSVCSVLKVSLKQKETKSEENEATPSGISAEENIIATKLTAGGISGIIICILVLLVVAGITIYHLCPPPKIRQTLLEQETESI